MTQEIIGLKPGALECMLNRIPDEILDLLKLHDYSIAVEDDLVTFRSSDHTYGFEAGCHGGWVLDGQWLKSWNSHDTESCIHCGRDIQGSADVCWICANM